MDGFAGIEHGATRVDVERDALGKEARRSGPGWMVTREYDAVGRLARQRAFATRHGEPTGAVPVDRTFGYDAAGRLTTVRVPNAPTHYVYDAADQLVRATRRGVEEVFSYDPAGSVVQRLTDLDTVSRPWALAPGNVLREADGVRFSNDASCRRIQRVETSSEGGATSHNTIYGWDTLDRLREVVLPDGTRVRCTYDALGRRVRKDVLGPADAAAIILGQQTVVEKRSVTFLWEGYVLAEEIDSARPAETAKRIHVFEPGTFRPLLQVEGGHAFGVVVDRMGVPKELIDEVGRIAWRAEHGAWGDLAAVTRDSGTAPVASPFRLQGQYADDETGLAHTLYRYFDPRHGRWLSPDPVGISGGMNLSGFNAAPTMHADPLGLCAKRLQELAMQAYDNLLGNKAAIRARLSRSEKAKLRSEPWLLRCFLGSAVERELDALVLQDPEMQDAGITARTGSGPEYGGNGGRTLELTTNNPGTVEAHANRSNPHNSGMVVYPALGDTDPTAPR